MLMMSFNGEMRNNATSFLSLFGKSMGKVERVLFNLLSFVCTSASVTWGGGKAGKKDGSWR